jgi:serine protease Do
MWRFVLIVASFSLGVSTVASAQESLSAEQLKRLKAATVFIKVQAGTEGATGSGFLIRVDGTEGYVVTNHHVIEQSLQPLKVMNFPATKPGSKIEAVFDSGSPQDRSLRAEILSVDPDKDLAVLRVKSAKDFPEPLDLQNVPKLRETLPVFICGFPFGESLSQARNPEITIGPATVSSIRTTATGQLREVQLTGSLNSGNSGGPVVTADGKLIGVARATIRGSGIGLAIPQQEVVSMLRGRVGALRLVRLPDSPGYQLNAALIDPLKQIESATLHVQPASGKLPITDADAPAKLLPGGSKRPLSMTDGYALTMLESTDEEEPTFRVQVELQTKSGTFFSYPQDISLRTGSGSTGRDPGVRPPPGGKSTELPSWIKDLLEDRIENMPKMTETLPPTAAGTLNLSDLNKTPNNYVGQSVQVNALTSARLTERSDGYELDAHAGSGKTPANLRLILPKDIAFQLNDLGIEPDETFAVRLLGTVEKPKALGEVRHTLKVTEFQFVDSVSGTPAVTFRPETSPANDKATLGKINRFPGAYVGQNFTLTMVFAGVATFRSQPEVDLNNWAGAKPLNLDFYTSKGLATQAEDEIRGGKQLAKVSFKVERVNAKTGKGVLGVNKIELLNSRDGRVTKTLSATDNILYPPEVIVSKAANVTQPKAGNATSTTAPTSPKAPQVKSGSWVLWAIIGGAFVVTMGFLVVSLGVYFLYIRKKPDLEETSPEVQKPSKAKPKPVNNVDNGPDEFPGFG